MRRILTLLLLAALLISLAGCRSPLQDNQVEFYYRRVSDSFSFGAPDAVIAPETRSFTNSSGDLTYLLSIYLQGPQDPQLRAPFPVRTTLLSSQLEADVLTLTLDQTFARLEGMDLTIACACLSQTCFGITPANQICIRAEAPGDQNPISVTISRDQLLFEDTTELIPEETTEKP